MSLRWIEAKDGSVVAFAGRKHHLRIRPHGLVFHVTVFDWSSSSSRGSAQLVKSAVATSLELGKRRAELLLQEHLGEVEAEHRIAAAQGGL